MSSETVHLPLPDTIIPGQIRWSYAIAIGFMHLLALAAVVPLFFSWTGLIVMIIGVGFGCCAHGD